MSFVEKVICSFNVNQSYTQSVRKIFNEIYCEIETALNQSPDCKNVHLRKTEHTLNDYGFSIGDSNIKFSYRDIGNYLYIKYKNSNLKVPDKFTETELRACIENIILEQMKRSIL